MEELGTRLADAMAGHAALELLWPSRWRDTLGVAPGLEALKQQTLAPASRQGAADRRAGLYRLRRIDAKPVAGRQREPWLHSWACTWDLAVLSLSPALPRQRRLPWVSRHALLEILNATIPHRAAACRRLLLILSVPCPESSCVLLCLASVN